MANPVYVCKYIKSVLFVFEPEDSWYFTEEQVAVR